jgi:DNA recombination protein RmuC
METFIIVLFVAIIALLSFGMFFLFRKLSNQNQNKNTVDEAQNQLFLMLQRQIQDLNRSMEQKMENTHNTLQSQFSLNTRIIQDISGQSSKMIGEITEKLTNLDKTNQQVIGFSEQLNNLEKVLTHQKQRGSLGEAGLALVLENILPPTAFKLQYQFQDGDVVDAAIFCKDGIIPVDSKFSLDNYSRLTQETNPECRAELEKEFKNDLKKRIDETSKYIKPKEGTLEFAFMFIPAEGIYYDLLINEVGAVKVNTRNLIDYAFKEKKVIIVSPTTFAAYLLTVLQGLRALKIEESAKGIRQNVEQLQRHIIAYEEYMKKLGLSLGTTVNHYNTASKELGKIDKDIVKITGGEKGIEVISIDKPLLNENDHT